MKKNAERKGAPVLARNAEGFWTKNGIILEHVTNFRPDKIFKAKFVRCKIKPSDPVMYYPESITRIEKGMPEEMVFITIIAYDQEKAYPMMAPINLLDLNEFQREELMAIRRLHLKIEDFEKIPIAMDAFFRSECCQETQEAEEE